MSRSPTTSPLTLSSLVQPNFNILLYGAAATGKTTCVLTSQLLRTFAFDVDNGAIAAKAHCSKYGLRSDMVHVWETGTPDDFTNGYNYLINHLKDYDLVVVDTASEFQQMVLSALRKTADIQVAGKREWGIAFSQLEDVMRLFRHLPLHVIWTAHERAREDEQFHRLMYAPSFQGQFGDYYSKHFSEIWRYCIFEQQQKLEDGKVSTEIVRLLKCKRDQFTVCKDRSLGLGEYEEPNIDQIFDKMYRSVTSKNIDLNSE